MDSSVFLKGRHGPGQNLSGLPKLGVRGLTGGIRFHEDIPKSEGVRSERWKYIRYFEQRPVHKELYDLESDPFESENLAGEDKCVEQLHLLRDRCDSLREEATAG